MPRAPGSRCTEPGCGTITTEGRCERHQRKAWANVSANGRALSGRQRENLRKRAIREQPACRNCGSTADLEVDHIIEVADGGSLADRSNLQVLCHSCHLLKTAAQRSHRAAQRQFHA
jgi:5-methylcytosine-specific restriction protein A